MENTKSLVNSVFYPKLEKDIRNLNAYCEEHYGVRVGVEIGWFFEKID